MCIRDSPTDEANGCGYEVNEVLRYANEIRYQISQLPEEEKATYEYIQYLCILCWFI